MKKKSIAARLGVMAVALTLATTSLTSGTLAKYVTEAHFTAKAMVAAWNPDLAVKKGANYVYNWQTSFGTMDLSLADTKTSLNYAVYNKKIAPGMEGAIDLQVSNYSKNPGDGTDTEAVAAKTSEVDTNYIVYINADNPDNAPTNLTFSYGGTAVNFSGGKAHQDYGWKLAEGTLAGNSTTGNARKDLKIQWTWPYEKTGEGVTEDDKANYDLDDVTAGEKALTTTYTITVVMTQANPQTENDVHPTVID